MSHLNATRLISYVWGQNEAVSKFVICVVNFGFKCVNHTNRYNNFEHMTSKSLKFKPLVFRIPDFRFQSANTQKFALRIYLQLVFIGPIVHPQ